MDDKEIARTNGGHAQRPARHGTGPLRKARRALPLLAAAIAGTALVVALVRGADAATAVLFGVAAVAAASASSARIRALRARRNGDAPRDLRSGPTRMLRRTAAAGSRPATDPLDAERMLAHVRAGRFDAVSLPEAAAHELVIPTLIACALHRGRRVLALEAALHLGPHLLAEDGLPVLVHAVRYRAPAVLAALLRRGADPDAAGNAGWTALHEATKPGAFDPDAMHILLRHGANPLQADVYGLTPLELAAAHCPTGDFHRMLRALRRQRPYTGPDLAALRRAAGNALRHGHVVRARWLLDEHDAQVGSTGPRGLYRHYGNP